MHEVLDRMAAQRDAHASRLYWFTDLEEAKAEAQRSGKPILSLRLLGRLDDEMSCANSRLFRLMLYANADVSRFLREHYVLHWSSERPAPTIALDFGDGRVVKRTITGNSVHYVLDARGRVVDALPGLYGPSAFRHGLEESLELATTTGAIADDEEAEKAITKHHVHATWRLTAQWRKLLLRAYEGYEDRVANASLPQLPVWGRWPDPLYSSLTAAEVNELTYSKADTEAPALELLQPEVRANGAWGDWSKISARAPVDRIDEASRALVREKTPRDWTTGAAPPLDAAKLDKRFALFESRMTEEALRNEYVFHAAIHGFLAKRGRLDLAKVNDFVYASVFMTPKSDAWLGLRPTEAITGLPNDGIAEAR